MLYVYNIRVLQYKYLEPSIVIIKTKIFLSFTTPNLIVNTQKDKLYNHITFMSFLSVALQPGRPLQYPLKVSN